VVPVSAALAESALNAPVVPAVGLSSDVMPRPRIVVAMAVEASVGQRVSAAVVRPGARLGAALRRTAASTSSSIHHSRAPPLVLVARPSPRLGHAPGNL